jgi:type I restriction enzyme S subunit
LAKGIRERSTDFRFNDFAKLNLPIPPRDEQDRIANFLDQKTAEIDEAIAKKQRLIELLKEQKAILINQAVTKGLNSDVPMRDSGVEWIGEVPAHWNVVRLKHISNKVTDGEHISPKTIENGIPLLSAKDVRERYILFEAAAYVSESDARKFRRRCNPERGDILIVSRGATVGRIGLVETDQEFCLMGSVILVKPKDDVDPGFLYYSLNQEDVQRSILQTSDASAQQAVYLIDVKETVICIPPMQEQVTIYNRIQPQIEEIDHAINLQFRKIASLTEIKAVYISSAVTGKIKF